MDAFLCNAMKVINEPERQSWGSAEDVPPKPVLTDRGILTETFTRAMTWAEELFGRYAFRKSLPGFSAFRSPINKALFEAWACQLSLESEETFQCLLSRKKRLFEHLHNEVYPAEEGKFLDAISRYSHEPTSVKYRHSAIEKCIRIITEDA